MVYAYVCLFIHRYVEESQVRFIILRAICSYLDCLNCVFSNILKGLSNYMYVHALIKIL